MRRTATTKELAQATGKTRQAVAKRLTKFGCSFLWQKGSAGNEKHYLVSFLPEDYRIAIAAEDATPVLGNPTDLAGAIGTEAAKEILAQRATEKEICQIAQEEGMAAFERLPESRKLEAQARYSFLQMCNGFVVAAGFEIRRYALRSKVGDKAFVAAYNAGKVTIDEAIREIIGTKTSYSTLKRIADAHYKRGIAGLAFGYHNPKRGSTALTDEQQDFTIAIMCRTPETSTKNVRRALQGRFGMEVPSLNIISRFRNRWVEQNQDLWLFYTNPDAWKNKKMFAFGSASVHVERLNQLWEADSTPADLMLSDGRHSIIGMIDVYSRRLRFVVSKTSKASSVVALIRQCLMDWGVPEIIKTDNGKDYVSNHVVRVLDGLQIEQQLCTPFQGQEKPHVERAFKTFLHGLVELMPNYIGHNVTDRKAIEARRSFAERIMKKESEPVELSMTSKELQAFCNQWVNFIYSHDNHGGLGGRKPIEMVRNWKQPIRRISEMRALDMLLMPAPRDGGMRSITKKGVAVDGKNFQSGEFAGHVGDRVYVLVDPTDLGTVYVYLQDENGDRKFLCPAIDPVWVGIDPARFAVMSRKHQSRIMKEGRRELNKNAKEQGTQHAYVDYLEMRKEQAGNVVEMPQKAVDYTTPELQEGAKAVEAISLIREDEEGIDILINSSTGEVMEKQPEPKSKVVLLMSDSDRYVQIRDRVKEVDRKLTEMEYDWLGEYYLTTSGKMYKKLEGDLRQKVGMADHHSVEV